MINFIEGDVVICVTGQAGTLIQISNQDVWVLLANGNIWTGLLHDVRRPQNKEDLDSCPLEVERFEKRENFKSRRKTEKD